MSNWTEKNEADEKRAYLWSLVPLCAASTLGGLVVLVLAPLPAVVVGAILGVFFVAGAFIAHHVEEHLRGKYSEQRVDEFYEELEARLEQKAWEALTYGGKK